MSTEVTYIGKELDLFARATNWKSYLRRQVAPYLGRDVLEVGAGFGGTTQHLCRGEHDRWLCLEPDPILAGRLEASIASGELPDCCRVEVGTTHDRPDDERFDTMLYIDVLEHISDDAAEVARAAQLLRPDGYLIVLSPTHQMLYTPFDAAVGHYRRYSRRALAALTPPDLRLVRLHYLDSVGILASLGNRLLQNRSMPAPWQISLWDGVMVRLSRWVDPLLFYSLGKSAFVVWQKPDPRP
jgi:SAM-dependent methyltransferase